MINFREDIIKELKEIVKEFGDMDLLVKEDRIYTVQEVLDKMLDEESDLSAIVDIVRSKFKYYMSNMGQKLERSFLPKFESMGLNLQENKKAKIMVFRPSFDKASEVSNTWGKKCVDMCRSHGYLVEDISGDRATKYNFNAYIKDADIVFYFDHGGSDKLAAQNREILLDLDTGKDLEKRPINMMACLSMRELGPYLVDLGSPIAMGYKEPFVFMVPPMDALFRKPALQTFKSLVQGKNAGTAIIEQQREFYLSVGKSLLPLSGNIISTVFLVWDALNARMKGDAKFKL